LKNTRWIATDALRELKSDAVQQRLKDCFLKNHEATKARRFIAFVVSGLIPTLRGFHAKRDFTKTANRLKGLEFPKYKLGTNNYLLIFVSWRLCGRKS